MTSWQPHSGRVELPSTMVDRQAQAIVHPRTLNPESSHGYLIALDDGEGGAGWQRAAQPGGHRIDARLERWGRRRWAAVEVRDF